MRIVLATLLTALLAGGLADPDTVTIHLAGDSTINPCTRLQLAREHDRLTVACISM